ncbi:ABC transporter permease [Acuticoccus mangrovi]|uniref:Iron chelate uptake ABC transporter family permease subunit n=1 Tax=Acuticoccus mangrovi TaxID=2796142 RepID=A0A934IPQ6_9HYPH|nr:iron chelate uptake ABC transporter family permease subunit [Acuticoccus mangrovi]MBJ3778771.1 iron chelate uptake ABC transporter family permease subunit [Acuticoccus mangrovi]
MRRLLPAPAILGTALLLAALAAASLVIGVGDLFARDGTSGVSGLMLLLASRLPRTLAAILTGAALAIAGTVMQTLAKNRFVDPMTAGTGSSAALGILLVTLLAPGAPIALKALAGSAVAFLGTLLFLRFARDLPPTEPFLVPLFGIVYGGVVGAIAAAIAWEADLVQFLDVWMNGEFSGVIRGRYELLFVTALLGAVAFWAADRLTILSLGRATAVGLGLDHAAMLRLGLVIVALIAGVTVVTVGIIPFVGLVVPALIGRRVGDDVRRALPLTALLGAGLVLGSDILGRLLRYPYEVPVGTVLGVVGAAAFLAIVLRRARLG